MSRITRRTIIPVNQITPLTYRDGVTYIQLLTELSDYIKSILHPSLQHTVDQLVADVEAQMDKHHDQYVDGVQEFQRIHDAFMSDVNAKLIALNDGAVADLVEDETSLLGKVLRSVFTDRTSFDELSGDITFRVSQIRSTMDTRFADMSTTVDQRLADTEHQLIVRPMHYGAIGDGVTDDTDAIQAFIDAGNTVFDGGTYRVRDGFHITGDRVMIEGNSTTLIVRPEPREHVTVISVTGDHAHISGFTIDGGHKNLSDIEHGVFGYVAEGIRVDGAHATVTNNTIRNLFSPNDSRAIRVDGIGGASISNNHIHNIGARGSGVTGDGSAVSRGIQFHNRSDAEYWSTISNNHIQGVYGQGSAGIATLHYDNVVFPARDGLVNITNNTIMNTERRAIKCQTSNTHIAGNIITDDFTESRSYAAPCVDIQNSNNVHVENNLIQGVKRNGIHVTAQQTDGGGSHVNVVNNVITLPLSNQRSGMYIAYMGNIVVHGNTIQGGKDGITMGQVNVGAITSNTVSSQHQSGDAIRTVATVERVAVANNVDSGSYRVRNPFQIGGYRMSNVNNHFRGVIVG